MLSTGGDGGYGEELLHNKYKHYYTWNGFRYAVTRSRTEREPGAIQLSAKLI